MAEWARWARAEVERWPDVGRAEVSPDVIRAFEAALAEASGASAARLAGGDARPSLKSGGGPADR